MSESNSLLVERPKELYDAPTRGIFARISPFDTASVQFDATTHGLPRYYVHYYHAAQWLNEPSSRDNGPYSYKASVHRIVTTAVIVAAKLRTILIRVDSQQWGANGDIRLWIL